MFVVPTASLPTRFAQTTGTKLAAACPCARVNSFLKRFLLLTRIRAAVVCGLAVRTLARLHDALPVCSGIDRWVVGLAPNGGRVEQNLRAHQHQTSCLLRVPLIPADSDSNLAVGGVKHLQTEAARGVIEGMCCAAV